MQEGGGSAMIRVTFRLYPPDRHPVTWSVVAGTTRDIRVVESSHPVFEQSCIEAAEKFRYRPRFMNGEAIEVPGVRNRCTYRLNE